MNNNNSDSDDNKIRSIRDWLQRYANFSERLFKSGRTLDDQRQSPLFAGQHDIELQSARQLSIEQRSFELGKVLDKTGFISRSVIWEEESGESDVHTNDQIASVPSLGKYTFLSDWERLWNYFAEENSDEVAVQLPFLRAAMELIFHPRIVQFMYFLFVWNIVGLAFIEYYFPGILDFGQFVNVAFQIIIYLLVCVMNKGPSSISFFQSKKVETVDIGFAHQTPAQRLASVAFEEEREVAQEAIDQQFSLSSSFRRLLRRAKQEFVKVSRPNQAAQMEKQRKSDKRHSLYFYRWLNMAMKVLTRDYNVNIRAINFNRRTYSGLLFLAVFVFPLYQIGSLYYGFIDGLIVYCGNSGTHDDQLCHFNTIVFISTAFGLVPLFFSCFFGMGILVSLTGLAYGGEISFRLAECWIQKYHSLRRIEIGDNGDDGGDKAKDVTDEKGKESTESAETKDKSSSGPENAKKKQKRRASLAQIPIQDVLNLSDAANVKELHDIISRDAGEHYLFISELLRIAGDLWSPVLLLFIFLIFYLCLSDILLIVSVTQTTSVLANIVPVTHLIIYVFIRIMFLLVYPILSIAFANTYFIKMYDIFRMADENDYQLIGGRDRWLSLFTDAPPTWTFFGLAITPQRLFAVLWTALITLGGIFMSTIISNSA